MNRSNSFVNSLKWWPLQGHNNNNNNNNNNNTNNNSNNNNNNNNHIVHHHQAHNNKTCTFGSSVAVQKLRESKWFKIDEQRIFCAVVECGFIVEVRCIGSDDKSKLLKRNLNATYGEGVAAFNGVIGIDDDDDDDDDDALILLHQDENIRPLTSSWFGVVLCKTAKDHKPKPETIEIYTVKIRENGTFKMLRLPLEEIWKNGCELRINNFADKEKAPHNEKDIRNQVSFARKAKQSLWNNNKHFAYWCRYGCRQQDVRKRQMSECVKWGSVGMNAGMLLVMNKQKSLSASK